MKSTPPGSSSRSGPCTRSVADRVTRIYLDNAATSFPKPETVYVAVERYQRTLGAAVARGGYSSAVTVSGGVARCRARLAELFHAESPDRFVFGFNGTDVLNLAIHGLLRAGDRVVTTQLEHNSVIRPLTDLRERLGIHVTVVPATANGTVDVDRFREALAGGARLAVFSHASNVSGAILPIADLGAVARAAGAFVLVDAAQSAGHVPVDLGLLPIDLLACSGHKGLLGPLGTGVLYLRPGMEEHVRSVRQGGTGSASEDERQPASLPEKYECGNHNAPGLCGLEAGVNWLLQQGVETLHRHEQQLVRQLGMGLQSLPGVRLTGERLDQDRVGVLSVSVDGLEPHDLAAILDESFGIEARAGLHCAPGVHRALRTIQNGGSLRLSVGAFTTASAIEETIDAFRQITGDPRA